MADLRENAVPQPAWDIQRKGRCWSRDEWRSRWELLPQKTESIDGEILMAGTAPHLVLGALLEYLGADRAVALGDLAVWQAAVAARETALEVAEIRAAILACPMGTDILTEKIRLHGGKETAALLDLRCPISQEGHSELDLAQTGEDGARYVLEVLRSTPS